MISINILMRLIILCRETVQFYRQQRTTDTGLLQHFWFNKFPLFFSFKIFLDLRKLFTNNGLYGLKNASECVWFEFDKQCKRKIWEINRLKDLPVRMKMLSLNKIHTKPRLQWKTRPNLDRFTRHSLLDFRIYFFL